MRAEKPVGFSWGGSFPADQHPSIHLMGSRAGLRRLIGQRNLFYVEYGICKIGGKYITFEDSRLKTKWASAIQYSTSMHCMLSSRIL